MFDLKFSFSVVSPYMEDWINKKFLLEDKLYKLGFSRGLLENVRQKQITAFVEKYKDDLDRLEGWIGWLEENLSKTKSPGAYLRRMMERDCEPNN